MGVCNYVHLAYDCYDLITTNVCTEFIVSKIIRNGALLYIIVSFIVLFKYIPDYVFTFLSVIV